MALAMPAPLRFSAERNIGNLGQTYIDGHRVTALFASLDVVSLPCSPATTRLQPSASPSDTCHCIQKINSEASDAPTQQPLGASNAESVERGIALGTRKVEFSKTHAVATKPQLTTKG
eukprot:6213901-Pleurochrysis_carterae.AAC.5